ncbi:hypothetical protein HYU13_03585 [Candidatus Woesearchaeota archaeon]|nr:hypothetical protein [Candidatus Woesearchaeota archaeon]
MAVSQELFYDFKAETVQELLNPVLHRVDIAGLTGVQSRWLIEAQKMQRSFIRGARRFYSGKGDFPDMHYLQGIWNSFKNAVIPAEFDNASALINRARQEAFKEASDYNTAIIGVLVATRVIFATGARPGSNPSEQARALHRRELEIGDRFYGSLVKLFGREDPKFLLHYVFSAPAINNAFEPELNERLTDEQIKSLGESIPEVKVSPQEFPYNKPL